MSSIDTENEKTTMAVDTTDESGGFVRTVQTLLPNKPNDNHPPGTRTSEVRKVYGDIGVSVKQYRFPTINCVDRVWGRGFEVLAPGEDEWCLCWVGRKINYLIRTKKSL